jgi:hypothetical protein
MVLIVGMLASAYFIYTINQNTLYNEAVRQNNLEQISYLAESINVTAQPQYIVSANTVRLVTDLQNDGSVSVEIKTLWVHGINTNHYGYVDLDLILNPGQNATITQNIAVTNATSAESFYGWVVTTRGRTINLYPAHQIGPQGA